MPFPRRGRQRRPWATVIPAVLLAMAAAQAARAQLPYARSAWIADIPPGLHGARALVTIVDERTLEVEHFTYDGTAPQVYFRLGASDDDTAFANGLQIGPLLDRPYNNEVLTLTLPAGETLDGFNAISVWSVSLSANFSSASFTAPPALYERAGWVADIPPGLHLVEAEATIITDRIIRVERFTYDGSAPIVYFDLGATDDYDAFLNGLRLEPRLTRPYQDESLVLLLPVTETLDGYGAIAVWCDLFSINFGSASFVAPVIPTPAVSPRGLVVLALLTLVAGTWWIRHRIHGRRA